MVCRHVNTATGITVCLHAYIGNATAFACQNPCGIACKAVNRLGRIIGSLELDQHDRSNEIWRVEAFNSRIEAQ